MSLLSRRVALFLLPSLVLAACEQTSAGMGDGLSSLAAPAGGDLALSGEAWTSATNGWGPTERDRSNGEMGAGDGQSLTLQGVAYPRGLGVHAGSMLTYDLGGRCTSFTAAVGVDDEVGPQGSVTFQVFADGGKLYDSGTMTGESATESVDVSLTGKDTLKLVVTDAGDGISHDHADWAGPLLKGCAAAPTAADSPTLTPEQFGAQGDGVTDDTNALVALFRALNTGNRAAAFGAGKTYLFRKTSTVQFNITRDGATVYGNGATLKVADGTPTTGHWFALRIAGPNITVQDLTVDANRGRRPTMTAHHAQTAWFIDGGSRAVTLRRVRGLGAPLDGMYIRDMVGPLPSRNDANYPTDILLENVELLNSGRNNLSVISSKNLRILGGKFNGARGVNGIPDGPWAGIDMEPNRGSDLYGNNGVYIEGAETSDNAGPGIDVAQVNNRNIVIKNHRAHRNGAALFLSPSGSISVDGLKASGYSTLSTAGVIALVPSDVPGATVTLRNLEVSDATDTKPILFQNYPGKVSLNGLTVTNVVTREVVGAYEPATISNVYRDGVRLH